MNVNQDKIIKEFFVRKAKQLILTLDKQKDFQIGYMGDQNDKLIRYIEATQRLEAYEQVELVPFIGENRDLLIGLDMKKLSYDPKYAITLEEQKALSKELIGREITFEEFSKEIMQSR